MIKGEIVLVEFPFTDLSGSKLRPALVLAEKKDDVLVAFITSKAQNLDEEDLLLIADERNRLKNDSRLRLFRYGNSEKKTSSRTIGYVSDTVLTKIDEKLLTIFKISK